MKAYELATSIHFRYDRTCQVPVTYEIERLASCGFKNLDFNFLDMCQHECSDFLSDDYISWIKTCKETADRSGVRFVQAHAPCDTVYDFHSYDVLVHLCKRAMECCSVLGIPWMVYHPILDPKYRFNSDEDVFAFNLKFFRELLPYAEKYSVGIAIENIIPYMYEDLSHAIDDQIKLIDTLDSRYVGACLDVGHLNIFSVIEGTQHLAKQSDVIRRFGDRLKCTHIHDNNAKNISKVMRINDKKIINEISVLADEHLSPYMGTIDWDDVIAGLDAIGYNHYFTYEAHRAANSLPEKVVNSALVQLREIGECILSKSKL